MDVYTRGWIRTGYQTKPVQLQPVPIGPLPLPLLCTFLLVCVWTGGLNITWLVILELLRMGQRMHCEIYIYFVPEPSARPCSVETIGGPVGGLVIEDVGVRDKAPSEIPSRSAIIPRWGLGSCSTADISIYICHVWIWRNRKKTRQKEKGGRRQLMYGLFVAVNKSLKHLWVCHNNRLGSRYKWLLVECTGGSQATSREADC